MLGGECGPGIATGQPDLPGVQVDAGVEPEDIEVVWEALEVGADGLPAPVGEPGGQRQLPGDPERSPPIEPRETTHLHRPSQWRHAPSACRIRSYRSVTPRRRTV